MTLDPGDLVLTGTPEGVALSGRFPYLQPGDIVMLCSDGVTEALSETGEEFGDERLERALGATRDRSAQAGLDEVLAEVQKFSGSNQYDDITLIVCTVTASARP